VWKKRGTSDWGGNGGDEGGWGRPLHYFCSTSSTLGLESGVWSSGIHPRHFLAKVLEHAFDATAGVEILDGSVVLRDEELGKGGEGADANGAVGLGDGDDGRGPRGRARANDAGREKAANIVVDGSSFGRAETTGAVSDWVRLGGADAEWLDVGQAKRAFSTGLKGKASTARSRRVAQLEGSHEDDVSINDRGTRSGSSSGLAGAAKVNSTAAARATEATLANSLIGSRRSGDKSVRSEAWLMPVWSPAELINYVACK